MLPNRAQRGTVPHHLLSVLCATPILSEQEVEEARKRATQASEHYKGTDSSVSDFMNLTKTMEKLPPVSSAIS